MEERRQDSEMLIRIDTTVNSMDKHLEKLNGKVAENTKFRQMAKGGFAVISFIGVSSLVGIVLLWFSVFSNNDMSQRLAEMEGYFENADVEITEIK